MDTNTESTFDIKKYLRILQRRKFVIIIPAAVILLAVTVTAYLLPSTYKSEATILIEAQNVPEKLVQTTVSGYVEERMQAIAHIVFGKVSLLNIINKYDLYAELRDKLTNEELVEKLYNQISLRQLQSKIATGGAKAKASTVAYNISYEGQDPQKAAQVVNELVSLFLEENLKNRQRDAQRTVEFLKNQKQELRREIEDMESRIAEFKQKHFQELPEHLSLNLDTMANVEKELSNLQGQLLMLSNKRSSLVSRLKAQSPLETLRREYNSLRLSKSENHPDVLKLKNKIQAMEKEMAAQGQGSQLEVLEQKEQQLAALKQQYTDKHPDVIALTREVEEMREKVSREADKFSTASEMNLSSEAMAIKNELQSTEMQIQAVRMEISRLRGRLGQYQRIIGRMPSIEQEYQAMVRELRSARERLALTTERFMVAQEALELERSNMAEKMTLISPPSMPQKPFRPNRKKFFLVGMFLSLCAGLGTGYLFEFTDKSFHTSSDITNAVNVPILGSIPYLQTKQEKAARKKRRLIIAVTVVTGLLVGILVFHFFIRPLDIFMIQVLKKFDLAI